MQFPSRHLKDLPKRATYEDDKVNVVQGLHKYLKHYLYCNCCLWANPWHILDRNNLSLYFGLSVNQVELVSSQVQPPLLCTLDHCAEWTDLCYLKKNTVLLFPARKKSSSCNPIWASKEIMTWTALFILVTKTPKNWWYLLCLYCWQAIVSLTADCSGRIPEVLGFVSWACLK